MSDVSKIGEDILVNTATDKFQGQQDITYLIDGGFVITWNDFSNDDLSGRRSDIKAQRFDALGNKLGPEFLVNTATAGEQELPQITNLTNGGFVIAWLDRGPIGADLSNIVFQLFDDFGNKIGNEKLANTASQNFKFDHAITNRADGGFIIGWTESTGQPGGEIGVKTQSFLPSGEKFGPEILISSGLQTALEMTGLPDGRFVATWTDLSLTNIDQRDSNIKAQIFSGDGLKLGQEIFVNTETIIGQGGSFISTLANGGFVIAWTDQSNTNGDTSGTSVKAQLFSPDGDKIGQEFLVNTTTLLNQSVTSISSMPGGNFIISWTDVVIERGIVTLLTVKSQIFSVDGVKIGSEFSVNTTSDSFEVSGTAQALPNGDFIISWTEDKTPSGSTDRDVRAQRFAGPAMQKLFDDTANTVNFDELALSVYSGPFFDAGGGDDVVALPTTNTGIEAWFLRSAFRGGTGNDRITAGIAGVAIYGDAGDDIITGNSGDNRYSGGDDNDMLFGLAGNDDLAGNSGDDRLSGGSGDDLLDGGPGLDTAIFSGSRSDYEITRTDGAIQVRDLRANGDNIDTLISIERAEFSGTLISFSRFEAPGGIRIANFTAGAGNWSTQDRFPRQAADVNGDGFADIVGFGQAGVLVALGSANGIFAAPVVAVANFGVDQGWSSDNIFHRELVDVNDDGRDDIVGFGTAGVLVSLAQANGNFGAPLLGSGNFNPANGWTSQNGFARTLADVNGDGFADIIGFGTPGTFVALGTGNGNFGTANFALANFGANQGWTSDNQFHREVGDVNGDGRADIVGFGVSGTLVALGQANGTFAAPVFALNNFGTNQGWSSQDVFTRDLADVNGDGLADIVGFGVAGTFVANGQADGSFSAATFELANFGRDQGWRSDNIFHRELADVNGDGRADIVGFGQNGVFAALAFDGQVI